MDPEKFKKAALLIIDAQVGIDDTAYWGGNRNNPGAEENIKLLLDKWRQMKLQVVHVQHCSTNPLSPLRPGQLGNEIKELLEPLINEKVIQKSTPDAFFGTLLHTFLIRQQISNVVITGFITNNSVETSARMGAILGYQVSVVADATATFDKTGISGEKYPSSLVHSLSLANLQGEYAQVVTTQQVLTHIA